jgi:hypothetical protein
MLQFAGDNGKNLAIGCNSTRSYTGDEFRAFAAGFNPRFTDCVAGCIGTARFL